MRISAIILNYFGHRDTLACVESLLDQPILRILVVDNSANEEEESFLRLRLSGHDSVQIIATGKNLGFAGGVNFGLTELGLSNYDAFLLLNNDTLAPQGLVSCLTRGIEEEHLDLASPVIRCFPETDHIWSKGSYYNALTALQGSTLPHLRTNLFYLTGCCLFVRSKVFQATGLLDDAFFMYGEDIEFCFRASRHGFKLGLAPQAYIYHKASSSAVMNSEFYEYHVNRGHLLLSYKLLGAGPHPLVSVLVKTVLLGFRSAFRANRYGNRNAWKGYLRALRELPHYGRSR